jgi:hypothetical protein
MAFGAPTGSTLQYPVVAPAAQQWAQAAQQAPQQSADAAQKMAETKAATATAQNVSADAASAGEAARAKNAADKAAAEQQLQRTNSEKLFRTASMPGVERTPMGLAKLKQGLDAIGVEMPKTPNGLPDIAAIKALVSPKAKTFQEMTPQEKAAEAAEKPGDRTFHEGQPDDWQSRPAVTPLTEKGAEFLHAPVVKAEAALAAGKGTAQALKMAAISEYNALVAKGADTATVDQILNKDHTDLSPEYKNQAIDQFAQTQLDNIRSLIGFRADEGKLKQELIDQKRYQWDHPSAGQRLTASTMSARMAQQAFQFQIKAGQAERNLDARWASIQNSTDRNAITRSEAYLRQTEAAQNAAQGEIDKIRSSVTLMVDNGKTRDPRFQPMVDQAAALQKKLDANRPIVDAALNQAQQAAAGVYSGVTGNPSTVVAPAGQKYGSGGGVPPGSQPAATMNGKPIYLNSAGTGYVFADGSEAK